MKQQDKTQEIIDKLKEELFNYEIFFNNSTQGFIIHREGVFILANNAFLKIFNINKSELPNHTIYDFLSEESIKKIKENFENKFESEYELTGIKKNGEKIDILVRTKEIIYRNKPAIAVFIRDITEEKSRIKETAQRQEQIIKHRKILVFLAKMGVKATIHYENTIRNIIEIVSLALNAQLGGFFVLTDDNEFLRPLGLYGSYGEKDLLISFKNIKEYIENRISVIHEDNNISKIFPQIKFTKVDLIVSPVRYEGEVIGVAIFLRKKEKKWSQYEEDFIASVSDMIMLAFERWKRKQIEEELNNAIEQLKNLNKIKSDFISMISHELRTPLTSIIGFVSLLLKGVAGKLTIQQMEFISSIENNSKRLLKLINELLDISKIEKGHLIIKKSYINIIELINKVLDDMRTIVEFKKAKIIKNYQHHKIMISGDYTRLSQVITNLIDNAMKYSTKDIEIQLSVKNIEGKEIKDGNIKELILPNGRYVLINIMDNGIGIAKENLGKIFNIFTQLENINTRQHSGVGLGLYIAEQIVKQHNGFIWAESEGEGKGTMFNILLPSN